MWGAYAQLLHPAPAGERPVDLEHNVHVNIAAPDCFMQRLTASIASSRIPTSGFHVPV